MRNIPKIQSHREIFATTVFHKITSGLSWLVIIIVGLYAGRELAHSFNEHSQAERILSIQHEYAEILVTDPPSTSPHSTEFRHKFVELIEHADNVQLCVMTLQSEMLRLRNSREAEKSTIIENSTSIIQENCK